MKNIDTFLKRNKYFSHNTLEKKLITKIHFYKENS